MSRYKKTLLNNIIFILFSLSFSSIYANPYLIVSAMKKEYLPMVSHMHQVEHGVVNKIPYVRGKIGDKNIVAAYTGVGSINAGIVTSILINRFHPKVVVFTGVAAALQTNINYGDVVIAREIFSVNFGQYTKKGSAFDGLLINPLRNKTIPLVFKINPYFLLKIKKIKKDIPYKLHFGAVASDQHFPSDSRNDKLLINNRIDGVEMEGIGIAHACWLYKTPMLFVFGISDNINTKNQYTIKKAIVASDHAAFVVSQLLKHL